MKNILRQKFDSSVIIDLLPSRDYGVQELVVVELS